MKQSTYFLVTCEHGGNELPAGYQSAFASVHGQRCLHSHRGHDPGALAAARQFASSLDSPLIYSTISRLLVDLNRSPNSYDVFSEFTLGQTPTDRQRLLDEYHQPYRERVVQQLRSVIDAGSIAIQLSIHTFVPRFRGTWRALDVGILFDPARSLESRFCSAWLSRIAELDPKLRAEANQPYAGIADGLTTTCRSLFSEETYLGIEVEFNHRYYKQSADRLARLVARLLLSMPRNSSEFLPDAIENSQ